jgi:DNA-directed RNA polymerase subunit RPC12/RpoP
VAVCILQKGVATLWLGVLAARLFLFPSRQPKKTMLKTPCRNCGTNIEHEDWMSNTEAKCPACGQKTLLAAESPKETTEIQRELKIVRDRETIRRVARKFKSAAIWFCIFAAIGFVFAIVIALPESDETQQFEIIVCGVSISGSCLAAAGWLYLMAQIIHIRANTYKD